ncbi:MAG: DoxX family protein [Candidatus Omnitrophica bacterium]|nr:DoxX family protein [Candidatus Omnitrophota bacterium]
MMDNKSDCAKGGASLLLRLAVASIFIAAVAGKFKMGFGATVPMFQGMFKETWLPAPLVTMFATVLPWLEIVIPVWLLSGFRLKCAWLFSGLVLISLAFGMMVAGNYAVASSNYQYVLLCCAGLYFSAFDCLQWGCCTKEKPEEKHVHGASCKH